MVKVVALDKSFEGVARVSEGYYNTASLPELDRIWFGLFKPSKSLRERQAAFAKHKSTIVTLKPIFKEIILERNKMAVKKGYQNYFEFITSYNGLTNEQLELFFKRVDKFIEDLNKKLPHSKPTWYWSKYGVPDVLTFDSTKPLDEKEYSVESLCQKIKKRKLKIAEVIPRIEIKELKFFPKSTGRYPKAVFDWKKKSVTIFVILKKVTAYSVRSFFHELAHASTDLELLDKGVRPNTKSRCWREYEAIKVQLKLQRIFLPSDVRDVIEAGHLRALLTTLFEYEIYNHPDDDFDQTYAKVINRCFLKAHQTRNPFYVIDYYLINRPCSAVNASVALVELEAKI
ncbi:hypothetical protein L6258_00710 [Candidatus Parcubacteria bacterium]|nr:hypothetical protein [Candidatus Parcubacteria bacterium]